MPEFNVNDRVHIKESARFSFDSVAEAFAKALFEGVVTEIDDGGDYLNERHRPALMFKVFTPDGRQWDKFSAEELERIEDQP